MPFTWIPGDVSGGTALTDNDHLYNTHVNELRSAADGLLGTQTTQGTLLTAVSGTVNYLGTAVSTTSLGWYIVGTSPSSQFTNIETAINTAGSAGGGVVYVKQGTYTLTNGINFPSGSITLMGDGMARTEIKLSGTIGQDYMLQVANLDNVNFRDFTLNWGSVAGTACGIALLECDHINVDRVEIKNLGTYNTSQAIGLNGNKYINIKNSTFTWDPSQAHNFLGIRTAFNLGTPEFITVENCTFNKLNVAVAGRNHVIKNNYFVGWKNGAAVIVNDFDVTGGIVIDGNILENSGTAIDLDGVYPNGIEVASSDVSIINNKVLGCAGSGIAVEQGDHGHAGRCIISNNTSYNNAQATASTGAGIFVSGTTSNCVITGNNCYDSQGTPTQAYGVYITTGSSRSVVVGNHLYNNSIANLQNNGTLTTSTGNITA